MPPHADTGIQKRFILSIGLTTGILILELVGGWWTGSLALLSDAAHMFMDVFALALSYTALRLSALPADDEHTFGWHRLEVLAALVNGVSLLVIALGIWREAYERWLSPTAIRGPEMMTIAIIGLAANVVVARVLGGHTHLHDETAHDHDHDGGHEADHATAKRQDINLNSAFLHVVGDAISSVGVIVAAIVIWRTGWLWVDPLMSVFIGGIILFGAYRVLRGSLHILVEGTPEGINRRLVAAAICEVPQVSTVHDVHVWNICSGHIALSAHVVLEREGWARSNEIMAEIKRVLLSRFNIAHTTIQIETGLFEQAGDCD